MSEKYAIAITTEAIDDIQNAIDYYNSRKAGLGKRFFLTIDAHFLFLQEHYNLFAIRYNDVRCMRIRRFPYMIHYRISQPEKCIHILAVFCTFENPQKWK